MSTALAIAAVTATLRERLTNALATLGSNPLLATAPTVSTLAPLRAATAENTAPQLNLYLYQVTPNTSSRNASLPARDSEGRLLATTPPLMLDLYYVLSAQGSGELQAEILLGHGLKAFHDTPVLTRELIQQSLTDPALVASGLAEQVQAVHITPIAQEIDAKSRLWSALHGALRPCAAYQVSVVLIDAGKIIYPAVPVGVQSMAAQPLAELPPANQAAAQ